MEKRLIDLAVSELAADIHGPIIDSQSSRLDILR